MTSQQFLVCDNSTLANFKQWASAVSSFLATAGWTQSSDTGQVNWSTISSVPGSNAFVYEIWKPGDALTAFFLRLEYGNGPSSNSPTMRVSIATSTDGAGNLTGFTTLATLLAGAGFTAPSATATYECDFSGTNNRLSFLMWRNAPNDAPQAFALQRSLDSAGSPTGTYATVWTAGWAGSITGYQQSLYFAKGACPYLLNKNQSYSNSSGWAVTAGNFNDAGSSAFNSGIPLSNPQPCVGLWDYPCTAVGVAFASDITEGVPFTVTNQYAQSITYIPSKATPFTSVSAACLYGGAICVEFD